jgi:hypothetical protein
MAGIRKREDNKSQFRIFAYLPLEAMRFRRFCDQRSYSALSKLDFDIAV